MESRARCRSSPRPLGLALRARRSLFTRSYPNPRNTVLGGMGHSHARARVPASQPGRGAVFGAYDTARNPDAGCCAASGLVPPPGLVVVGIARHLALRCRSAIQTETHSAA